MRRLADCLPPVVAGIVHVLSAVGLVVLCKLVMHALRFPYAATLTLLHHTVIALSLWFWTLFGLFRPRPPPFLAIIPLGAASAFCALLSMLSLRHNSLSVYQAARLCTPPATLLFQVLRTPHRVRLNFAATLRVLFCIVVATFAIYSGTFLLAKNDPTFTGFGALFAGASIMTTAANQVWSLPLRETTNGNELQLQLYTKSVGALLILPFVPIFDDYSVTSAASIRQFEFDDNRTTLIFATALLAFLSFVAMRASVSRSSPSFYSFLLQITSVAIFEVDKFLFHSDQGQTRAWNIWVTIIMFGSIVFAVYRDEVIAQLYHVLPQDSCRTRRIDHDAETGQSLGSDCASSTRVRDTSILTNGSSVASSSQVSQRRSNPALFPIPLVSRPNARLNLVNAAALDHTS